MKNYKKDILNELLDSFDKRKEALSGSQIKRKVIINTKNSLKFKEYIYGFNPYETRKEINEAVDELEKLGFLYSKYDKDTNLLIAITLNVEKIDDICEFLGRTRKKTLNDRDIDYLEHEIKKCKPDSILNAYMRKILDLLKNSKSHLSYYTDFDELKLNVKMIEAVENQEEETLQRNFSKKRFGDSKLFERQSSRILKIFNEFSNEQYDNFTDFCLSYNILKTTGYAYVKNGITFKINKQVISLDNLQTDFSLSDDAIEKMIIKSISKKKVITIENLTTFHYYNAPDSIIIYLGGYHNSVKRKLILKINEFNNNLEWFHIGDIDWGGFQILLDLRKKTNIDFKPLMMGVEELIKYKDECSKLGERDIRKLNMLVINPEACEFVEVINFMIKNGYKLEQESLIFKE